jgi:Cof subfamily protein (haloacid dehalogenase superfamily)
MPDKLSNIKALVFDMDGTLLRPDKTLSARTRAALNACMSKGIRIILATGRGVEAAEPYRKAIGQEGPHVYYNGAEVLDMPSRRVIHTQLLGSVPALYCLELAKKGNHYLQAYFPSHTLPAQFAGEPADQEKEILLTWKYSAEADYYHKNSGLKPRLGDLEAALSVHSLPGIIKCMFITPEENHEALRNAITERFGGDVTVTRSSPIYLEILAKDVSKGGGLVHALKHESIACENAIAFGDEENDLPMFTAAGMSAAPANAVPAVLDAASFHIPSNADDGVACFLEERLL